MSKPVVGAQLYTVREFCKTIDGIAESLKKVRDIGYTAVQISGFGPADPKAVVRIDARMSGTPVPPQRIHLGANGRRAARLPLEVGASTVSLLQTAAPPLLESDEWALWIRSLPGNPVLGKRASAGTAAPMSEEDKQRLRALGYVK